MNVNFEETLMKTAKRGLIHPIATPFGSDSGDRVHRSVSARRQRLRRLEARHISGVNLSKRYITFDRSGSKSCGQSQFAKRL
jgi:hypothetical protein